MAGSKRGVIGILTGGGDVPGLNPAIRAVTLRAISENYQVIGLRRGWASLIDMVREKRLRQQRQLSAPDGRGRESRRAHRRHVPAYLAH
jgi:6-phosphofructokinase